jgi:integrase/recombinase XerD
VTVFRERVTDVRTATAADLIEWMDALTGAAATRARRVATVKSLFSFAWKTGYVPANVARVLKCVKVPDTLHERIMDEEHVQQLVVAAKPGRDRVLIRLLYIAGVRISEAVALRWKDIGKGRLTVQGKGARTRTLTVPEPILTDLRALRGEGQDDAANVFLSVRRRRPLDVRGAREIVYLTAERARLTLSPHWLRHAHATHAINHGCPIHVVQRSLGHKNVSTTSRYLHVRPDQGSSQYLATV